MEALPCMLDPGLEGLYLEYFSVNCESNGRALKPMYQLNMGHGHDF